MCVFIRIFGSAKMSVTLGPHNALQSSLTIDGAESAQALVDLLTLRDSGSTHYVDVDGPIRPEDTLIRYDVPFALNDPARSLRLRARLGLEVETRTVEPNVRIILDSFIAPRRWTDAKGVTWVQHASPFPILRTEVVQTQERFHAMMAIMGAQRSGICPVRTQLVSECFLEVIRQVVVESWERGLLLLYVHAERVAAQTAHREIFESRIAHAFRVALTGERDTMAVKREIQELGEKIDKLRDEESALRKLCDEFATYSQDQMLIIKKKHNDLSTKLKGDVILKKAQLEFMCGVPPQLH